MNADEVLTRFAYWGRLEAPAFQVRCKTSLGTGPQRKTAHLLGDVAGAIDGGRIRYGARSVCGYAMTNMTLLPADTGLPLCDHCQDRLAPCVYRCFGSDGALIYVGHTEKKTRRLQQHEKDSWWPLVAETRIQVMPSIEDARREELRAIRSENPLMNKWGLPRKPAGVTA